MFNCRPLNTSSQVQLLVRRHNFVLLDTDLMLLVINLHDLERLFRSDNGEAPSR